MTVPALALALYLAFLVVAFGLRTWIQVRRTGSSGFRGISGHPGSAEWWGGVLFVVAVVAGFLAPLLELAGALAAVGPLDHPAVRAAGVALSLAGIAATLAAQASMGDSWRIGVDPAERTSLVTDGAFALARNPIFAAMLVAALGLALVAPNPLAVGAIVLLLVAVELQVRVVEEPYLRRVHGAAFLEYERRVGRFAPRLRRHRGRRA